MEIKLVRDTHSAHQKWLEAFAAGLDAHAMPYTWMSRELPEDCDLAVGWGYNTLASANQHNTGGDYLTLERGFFQPVKQWCSTGFNGLFGTAEYVDSAAPKRFTKLFSHLLTPRDEEIEGSYFLIIGQDPRATHVDCDYKAWLEYIRGQMSGITSPIYYCPHPDAPDLDQPFEVLDLPLKEAISAAALCITWSSNGAVDAALQAVPNASFSKHQMTPTDKTDFEEWVYRMAWRQWSKTEMEEGFTWEVLKQRWS